MCVLFFFCVLCVKVGASAFSESDDRTIRGEQPAQTH